MTVLRIVRERWSHELRASGNEARWNSEGNFIIYTSASRALACLENFVHRSGENSKQLFATMVIEIPAKLKIEEIKVKDLPHGWSERMNFSITRKTGNDWLLSLSSAVLKVPSAIIPEEYNYLMNPAHNDFRKIRVLRREVFRFDERMA
ncbi:MAG TPA: RES family NAD+ phosphorylase [Chitinophagales bacterium]|nr:RES family NAD+ phosphorylase [Chitinophagales bacterium]